MTRFYSLARALAGGVAALTFAALFLAVPALAQPAAKPWPREVQAVYDGFKNECRAAGGYFVPDREFFATETEVNGDKKADWVVEESALQCQVSDLVRDSGMAPDGNANCGTAGCQSLFLISGKKGFVESYLQVRGWSVVDGGGGRKLLEASVHGSSCGGIGAEVCINTLRWNGADWDLVKQYRWTEADYERDQAAMASAEPYQELPRHETRWIFAGEGAAAIAAVVDHPEFPAIGIRCQLGGGLIFTAMPRQGLGLPPDNQPLMLYFYGSTEGIEGVQTLMKEPGKPDWSGVMAPTLEGLMSGRDTEVKLMASLDGGGEWQELTWLSLGGSTAALRSITKACAGASSSVAAAQASSMQPVGPLGIVPGYYVSEYESCRAPGFEAYYYDGKRWGLMGGNQDEFSQNIVEPLGKVRKVGKSFALDAWDMMIEVGSPTRIQPTIQDTGAWMRWCPESEIPANFRVK
ncbi:hypothetical protein LY632_00285 [Erythrobacter sp. SDW2]|uniref:hypothetical protein n=1 Tax=Erythrobacter sp. SDW2 TaxID=2907154 RepID=UPI001F469E55|nr:hypothetical protein [Erythrobacter sp. SDW2]UIP06873.1 hypothetical protein LY632_00285 [Erythrobacter sp. SDW2]